MNGKLAGSMLGFGLVAALVAGCYLGTGVAADNTNGGTDSGVATGGGPWCDVQAVLAKSCTSCHANPPVANAPMSLVTYDDLVKPSPTQPSKSAIQYSLERMQAMTMPPGGGATSQEIQIVSDWINQGMPHDATSCGGTSNTNYNTPDTCTSGVTVPLQTNDGSRSMNPGVSCMSSSCHGLVGWEKQMSLAGTVYATAHELDLCNGVSGTGKLSVQATDQNNKVVTAGVNGAGNFYAWYDPSLVLPFKDIRVVDTSGNARPMAEAAPSGDCNACHTLKGTNAFASQGFASSAPGRIMAP